MATRFGIVVSIEGQQEVKKTLPYDVWNEANFHLQINTPKYRN